MPPPKAMRSVTHVMSMRQSAPPAELSAAAGTPLAILQGGAANEFCAAGKPAIQAGGCESALFNRLREKVRKARLKRPLKRVGEKLKESEKQACRRLKPTPTDKN